jgi:hypothetical protein
MRQIMRVYLTNDTKIGIAKVCYVGADEGKYIGNRTVSFSSLPQPDQNDLRATIDKIIEDEAANGNIIDHYELYVLYSEKRFDGLKARIYAVPNEAADHNPLDPLDRGMPIDADPWRPIDTISPAEEVAQAVEESIRMSKWAAKQKKLN